MIEMNVPTVDALLEDGFTEISQNLCTKLNSSGQSLDIFSSLIDGSFDVVTIEGDKDSSSLKFISESDKNSMEVTSF